ncbi:ester cyclase [Pseudonocardia yuanmonensis]|uniref:Ester cyclase n=1 Tax=Pseudonocardia yuanmonensis TaxID=1095914 RepID=A0ABP8WBH7_9PSEU
MSTDTSTDTTTGTATDTTGERLARTKQLVDEFIQALFTRGELDAVDRYLAPHYVDHDPPVPDAPSGREALRRAAALFRTAFPDWHSDVEQLVAEGDVVVERFTARGTHRGEFLGVPPTGETVELAGINVFRLEGDRIVERWGRLDELGLLRRLGLVPAASTGRVSAPTSR